MGLEDAAQVPVGAVETVLGAEAYQPFQGHRDCDVACLERGVELTQTPTHCSAICSVSMVWSVRLTKYVSEP